MFLKSLKIENDSTIIREISFHKGINLIVDETDSTDKHISGNNVGKTTLLRLVYFCLGGKGENIYKDTEFKTKSNTQVEEFLKKNNVIITITLVDDLESLKPQKLTVRRNFLSRKNKIQEINGQKVNNINFSNNLRELIFGSSQTKPTLKQIVARNIRDERNRLTNTIKVLHTSTTQEEYEVLYLFWLGVGIEDPARKQRLFIDKKNELNLQKALRKVGSISQIEQSLLIINRIIVDLEKQDIAYNANKDYEKELMELNQTRADISRLSTRLSQLELRKELILESQHELKKEFSSIDVDKIKSLYEEASALIPNVQKTFEETLLFHNKMVEERLNYITQDIPKIEAELAELNAILEGLLAKEQSLIVSVSKSGTFEEKQNIRVKLNDAYEKKGGLEEQLRSWSNSLKRLTIIEEELSEINEQINSKDTIIQSRIAKFNKYFSSISNQLYGEQFVLSSDRNSKGYELNIGNLSGNLGTGKKKGQIAAFDLAYIQFADSESIKCLHFLMHDQIENVHDNQISNLLTDIVSRINCQYILPVLRDKLPIDIDVRQYEILSLNQENKLFKLP